MCIFPAATIDEENREPTAPANNVGWRTQHQGNDNIFFHELVCTEMSERLHMKDASRLC